MQLKMKQKNTTKDYITETLHFGVMHGYLCREITKMGKPKVFSYNSKLAVSRNMRNLLKFLGILFGVILVMLGVSHRFQTVDYTFQVFDCMTAMGRSDDQTLLQTLQSFPWDYLMASARSDNASLFASLASRLLFEVTPFLTKPPRHPIDETCTPPPLETPVALAHHPKCRHRSKPRRVGVLLQLGFDTDTLEIHFQELDQLVDYFFLLESTRSHYMGIRKPLTWDILKRQQRFQKFLPKVVHFVLDDSELIPYLVKTSKHKSLKLPIDTRFGVEFYQEKMRWEKFLRWNLYTEHFREDDLLGFGDADEIPSREAIHYLKHCDLPSDPVDIGVWFPFGRFDQAYKTDWPVKGHPYSYGDPTYWTLSAALNFSRNPSKYPTRNRGKSKKFMLGGTHMTHSGSLPFQITEYLTASSTDASNILKILGPKLKGIHRGTMRQVEEDLAKVPNVFAGKIIPLAEFEKKYPGEMSKIVKVPWFYRCNPDRYPTWQGLHDSRWD